MNVTFLLHLRYINLLNCNIMIKTKKNFKPYTIAVGGFGDTANKEIVFADVSAFNGDRLTFSAQNNALPLNQHTPFEVDNIPENIEQ